MGYCTSCGTELAPDVSYCPSCGREIAAPDEDEAAGGREDTPESTSDPSEQGGESAVGAGTDASQPATNASRDDAARPATDAGAGTSAQGSGVNASSGGGMSRRTLIAGGVGGAAVAVGGVAVLGGGLPGSSPPLDELRIRLVDVRYPDVGVTTATLPMVIAIENPTEQEINGLTGDLDIVINEQRVASEDVSITQLDPGEERHVDLEVLVEYADSGQAIREVVSSGSFELTVVASLEAGGAERRVERSTSL